MGWLQGPGADDEAEHPDLVEVELKSKAVDFIANVAISNRAFAKRFLTFLSADYSATLQRLSDGSELQPLPEGFATRAGSLTFPMDDLL